MAKKVLIPFLIVALAIVVSIAMIRTRPQAEQSESSVMTILVDVMPVYQEDAAIQVPSQGNVEPSTRSSLVAEVTGLVTEVSPNFVAGGFFRKDELLLKLDDYNYRAAVSRAEASVASARSLLEQERGQADVARREWERMTEAQQNQIRARELYLRQPQLQEAEARLQSAEADLEQARTELSKTEIRAPYDGMISEKSTDLGQFVGTGTSLAEIFSVDFAEVRLPIPENRLQFLSLPSPIDVQTLAGEQTRTKVELVSKQGDREYRWTGYLARTEGILDTRTRVLFAVVQVEDPYGIYGRNHDQPLRIGTFVNASISGEVLDDVVVLPRHTLQSGNMVWVTDQEKRLRARQVEVVTVNGDNAYIRSGFEPGDMVVITRLENPLNGMLVETNELPGNQIR